MSGKEMVSEKKHGKHKSAKKAQETNDTSELTHHTRENKKHKSSKDKEDLAMHKLSALVEASKIVESSPPTEGKPGRRKSRNPQKTRTAVVKPTQKSGKGVKKMKEKHSSNSDADDNTEVNTSESDESDYSEESYNDLKKMVSVMLSKLEKFENKKKKRQRKRKNKKGKHFSDTDTDDDNDVKPSKSQKKLNEDNFDKKSKENNEVTTSTAPDNSMMFQQLQYNQQMMMQQMYMTFMQPQYGFQPYGMPHIMPGATDPNVNLLTGGPPNTAMIIPGSSTSKSEKSSSTITSEKQKSDENYINVDIYSSQKAERKSKSGHQNQNDMDSDASEVYEPEPEVMKSAEQKSSDENTSFANTLNVPSDPTPSFIKFVDNMNNEDNLSTSIIQPTNLPSDTATQPKLTKKPTVSEEFILDKEQDSESNSANKIVGTNIADVLMNLIPVQVRKELNITSKKDKEEDRSEINTALRRMLSQNESDSNNGKIRHALMRLLSEEESSGKTSRKDLPSPETKLVKHGPPPLEKASPQKSYSDSSSWMRDCIHNLYLQDQDGDTILHIMIAKEDEQGALEIIKRMKGYRMDILNALGQTPLHLAMYIKNTKIIEALLQHGADVSIVDAHGNSPLHIACEENSLEMVKVLFDYQVTHRAKYEKIMKIRNNQGLGAVHIATQKENVDILRFLARNKINLDIQEGRSGNTPLVMALSKGHWELADFFLENGANVNIPNYSNCYPLHFAVQGNKMDMVKRLLSFGAEMGSKANEYENGNDSEIKTLLAKEMRKRRRQRARMEISNMDY